MASDNYFRSLGNIADSTHHFMYDVFGCICSAKIYTAWAQAIIVGHRVNLAIKWIPCGNIVFFSQMETSEMSKEDNCFPDSTDFEDLLGRLDSLHGDMTRLACMWVIVLDPSPSTDPIVSVACASEVFW